MNTARTPTPSISLPEHRRSIVSPLARHVWSELHRSKAGRAGHAARRPHAPSAIRRDESHANHELKAIEDVRVGDIVWAWDEVHGALRQRSVRRLFRHRNKTLLAISIVDAGGRPHVIEATTEHPFWVERKGWVPADRLARGDELKHIDGQTRVRVLSIQVVGAADVFNFEVGDAHTYFVGAPGVLVHNHSSMPDAIELQREGPAIASRIPFKRSNLIFSEIYRAAERVVLKVDVSGDRLRLPIGRINLDSRIGGVGLILENRVELGGKWRKLTPTGFSLSNVVLDHALRAYETNFEKAADQFHGKLEHDNLRIFQQEYILARQLKSTGDPSTWARIAIAKTPFGRSSIMAGYGDLTFNGSPVPGTVLDVHGMTHDLVPTHVDVSARPSGTSPEHFGAPSATESILDEAVSFAHRVITRGGQIEYNPNGECGTAARATAFWLQNKGIAPDKIYVVDAAKVYMDQYGIDYLEYHRGGGSNHYFVVAEIDGRAHLIDKTIGQDASPGGFAHDPLFDRGHMPLTYKVVASHLGLLSGRDVGAGPGIPAYANPAYAIAGNPLYDPQGPLNQDIRGYR
jgi:hypothetical protein